jgi:tetratricopeptide (TPR) repeat protein
MTRVTGKTPRHWWIAQLAIWLELTRIVVPAAAAPLVSRPAEPARPSPFHRDPDPSSQSLLLAVMEVDCSESESDRTAARRRMSGVLWQAHQVIAAGKTAEESAARALEFLHAEVLTGPYDPHCASLTQTFADGRYNCLIATVLYLAICRDNGYRAVPMASPGHVSVRMWLGADTLDVETTDHRWRPGSSRTAPAGCHAISDSALLGRVYYNLGIRWARAGQWERAIEATRQSLRLDPEHAEARNNLLAALHNGAIELARQGDLVQAETMIRQGLELDPNYGPLLASAAFVQQRLGTQSSGDPPFDTRGDSK